MKMFLILGSVVMMGCTGMEMCVELENGREVCVIEGEVEPIEEEVLAELYEELAKEGIERLNDASH